MDINAAARELLGKTVEDMVTGFRGVVVGVTEYMYACSRVTVEPSQANKDGGMASAEGFDCLGVEVVEGTHVIEREVVLPSVPMYSLVRDDISGIEGRVVALGINLYSEPVVGIQPLGLKDDGSINPPHFIAEGRVSVLGQDKVPVAKWTKRRTASKETAEPPNGGPQLLMTGMTRGATARGLR